MEDLEILKEIASDRAKWKKLSNEICVYRLLIVDRVPLFHLEGGELFHLEGGE